MNQESENTPAELFELAITEARKGVGLTAPNPPVGAVVVGADGSVLGRGHHARAGAPHAEVEAISDARTRHGEDACLGGTIVVTLEPCTTHGRTPPCSEAIKNAGITHVLWGADDPNPDHSGGAEASFAAAGIAVSKAADVAPDAVAPCEALIRPFAKWVTKNLPWVIAKVGASLDGRITRPPGESRWITSEAAREDAHRLRSEVDAILVGANTVRTDDPSLTIRGPASRTEKPQPWRAVLTRTGDLPSESQILTDLHRDRTLIYRGKTAEEALLDLAQKGCLAVLAEGGAHLHGQLFAGGFVDEVCFYLAPRICGGGTPAVGGLEFPPDSSSWTVRNPEISVLGGDNIRVRGLPVRADENGHPVRTQ